MDYQLVTGKNKRKISDDIQPTSPKKLRSDKILGGDKYVNITSHDNHIYYYASVTKKSALELNTEIRKITRTLMRFSSDFNSNPPPIYLHINSFGGSIFAALSVIDTIQYNPIPIYTIIEGAAASAATMISVYGKKRYITKSSHMLIHQLSSGFWGKMAEVKDEVKNLKNLMKVIKKIYKKKTDVPEEKLDKILKHDLWWNSKKCLKYGLVDKVIKSSSNLFDENVKHEY
jgi:ATP-dependent Clp endopeptidase proteolytic subunit ClpP